MNTLFQENAKSWSFCPDCGQHWRRIEPLDVGASVDTVMTKFRSRFDCQWKG